jgi:hypothetical protein
MLAYVVGVVIHHLTFPVNLYTTSYQVVKCLRHAGVLENRQLAPQAAGRWSMELTT